LHHTRGLDAPNPSDPSFFGDYWSDDQELWCTRYGHYFIVKRDVVDIYTLPGDEEGSDYDIIDIVEPISHKVAQDWLEKYANDKVEIYFSIPEAGSKEAFINFRTNSSISAAAKILAKHEGKSLNMWLNSLVIKALLDGKDILIEHKKEMAQRRSIAETIKNKEGALNVK
jgi:hypothetical protein